MSLLDGLLTGLATITAEAAPGGSAPQTGMGGADRTARLPVAAGVPCLVRPTSSSLSALSSARDGARRNVVDARIYFDADPAPGGLSTRHRIEVDGVVYAVQGVVDVNSMGELFQVDCEAVK